MNFSIKSPEALLWKTGYNAAQIKDLHEAGKLKADWLVCPLGDSTDAVTIGEFIENPSILRKGKEVRIETLPVAPTKRPMSVAAMGWWVFFGALFAYFLVALLANQLISDSARYLGRSSEFFVAVVAILQKGLDAIIVAGALTALLGHAYTRIAKGYQDDADQAASAPMARPGGEE